jgi:lactate dehydrogenase-like 2-hydroxyacid dehydrogenase
MKAFIFDPLWDALVTEDITAKIKQSGLELFVKKEVAPLSECKELFEGKEERLLCINPDYVSWKLACSAYKDIPNLKAILIASTGFEWVELDIANERNIPVCQVINFSTQAVAEWAVMMMLNLARQTPRLSKDNYPLDYDKDFIKYRGIQLKGKIAGIIGLGNIGSSIAEACKGLGMNVIYWSRSSTNKSYKRVELSELVSTADVIFPATAKTPETRALITDAHIDSIKKSAILVDISHGLFARDKIVDMIARGDLFGYGFEGAPHQFTKLEGNIWAAPAYGWATYESMRNSMTRWVDNMVCAARNEFPMRVNNLKTFTNSRFITSR